jgi:hypothetical protein
MLARFKEPLFQHVSSGFGFFMTGNGKVVKIKAGTATHKNKWTWESKAIDCKWARSSGGTA